MGATHRSKSTRATRVPTVNSSEVENELYEVLDHLGKAIAVAETVARALEAAEQDPECTSRAFAIVDCLESAVLPCANSASASKPWRDS
jgi:hypothetical protein